MAELTDSPKIIQVEEEIEGEHVETDDYFFCQVGDSIPLTTGDTGFDTNAIPSKPLALSQRFGLIFAAHSSGFCVAKTKDVIAAAKEIKAKGSGSTVQELSVVDVDIGRVSILALSEDSAYISAVIGNEIHFFVVNSLLNKDKKSIFSCSVESNHVKDMLWIKESEQSFIVLTDGGEMHLGAINKPLTNLMDKIDAVEKSVDGRYLAIGRKNNLTILSSQFKELSQIVIPLDSFTGEDSAIDTVKVDSIRWVRSDSIVVGCLQQTEGGKEENYFLQVIMSEDEKFISNSSTVTAVQFNYLFPGIVDDIVPYGCGPHLFTNYLENCEFAFVSNRKNTDQHIMLLSWSQGDNQVSVVDIERDSWLPRIELQENGDDNLVLGFCVDETSVYENVEVKIGAEEQRELRPHCLLVCLTLEGKLVMFSVASISGCQRGSQTSSSVSDNAQNIPVVLHSNLGEVPQSENERPKQLGTVLGSPELNTKGINSAPDVPVAKDPTKIRNFNLTLNSEQNLTNEPVAGNNGHRSLIDVNTSKPSGNSEHSQKDTSTQFSLKDSHAQLVGIEKWKVASPNKSLEKNLSDTNKGAAVTTGTGISHRISTPTGSNSYLGSGVSDARSPFVSPSSISTKSNFSGFPFTSDSANNAGTFSGNVGMPSSDSFNSSIGKAANFSQKTSGNDISGMTHSNPRLKEQLRETVVSQNSTSHSVPPMKGNHPNFPPFGQLNSEQNASKQFGNVQTMAKELDKLLEGIEEKGGFRDICTSGHRSSLEALEEGMQNLSKRSKLWQDISKEGLRETELLLDKTVQVLAKKTHMEGIVRQTTDEQYWDLWDRQKLSSELDQKQQAVLNLSQDLVNKMIELEKHFNALELNRFGERTGANLVSRALHCRSATPRYSQSLNAIHNATVSQLAAAEQLSDLLSRQMALLSVKSPSAKQPSVKKQVFDTIGIPYPDDNLTSPYMAKMFDSPPNKNSLISCSGATRRRNSEFSSSRRRRDSLDRNWAECEAPKTTVKRTLVQNVRQNGSGLFSSMDKRFVSPCKIEGSMATHSKSRVQDRNGGKGMHENLNSDAIATSAAFKWAGAIPETSRFQTEQYSWSPSLQDNSAVQNISASFSPSPSLSSSVSSFRDPDIKMEKSHANAERSGSHVGYLGKLNTALVDQKPFGSQWVLEKSNHQIIQPQPPSPPIQSNQMPTPSKESESRKSDDRSSSIELTSKRDQFSSKLGPIGTNVGSSSSLPTPRVTTLPVESTEGSSTTIGKVFKDASKEVSRIPLSAFHVSSPEAPSNPIPPRGPLREDSLNAGLTPQTNVATSSLSGQNLAPSVDKSKSDVLTQTPTSSEVPKYFGSSSGLTKSVTDASYVASIAPPEKQSTAPTLPSLSFPDSVGIGGPTNTAAIESNVTSNALPEKQSSTITLPSTSFPDAGGTNGPKNTDTIESNVTSNAPPEKQSMAFTTIAQEDEMEEVAPETNQADNFSLGSLAGFGLGPAVSTTATRSNPFGVSLSSTPPQSTPTLSPFTVPQGQLFRPASFNFQSPVSQQSQTPNTGAAAGQPPAVSGFGQPGQIGSGGQAMGSVLGSFGQSRQIGAAAIPGSGFGGPPSSSGGGFAAPSAPTGGFAGISSKNGGFACVGGTPGGFAGAATPGGVFAAAAPGGGGFGAAANSRGFAAAVGGGGGFGGFSNPGTGGFSAFGAGATGGRQPPSELFTQMRR